MDDSPKGKKMGRPPSFDMETSSRTTFRLPDVLIEKLRIYAASANRNRNEVLAEALAEYFQRVDNPNS